MDTAYISTAEARQRFSELVNQVFYRGKRVIVTSRGKPKIALVALNEPKLAKNPPAEREADKQRRLRAFRNLQQNRAQILQETKGQLADPVDILRQLRDERDQQILQAGVR